MNRAITISREYGSGRREIGEKLAQRLGIPFYDKELVAMIAEGGSIETSILEANGEVDPGLDSYSPRQVLPGYQIVMIQRIYAVRTTIIRSLNNKGPCIIVECCADAIFLDAINIFVFADMESRINCIIPLNPGPAREEVKASTLVAGKRRKVYDEYYSTTQWENMNAYDIYLSSGLAGVEGCLETALTYTKRVR